MTIRLDSFWNLNPVDTSDIVLPEELLTLTEKIAENVHDVWAVGRIAEGWPYGTVKDLEKRLHHRWLLITIFLKARKNMIGIQHWKH